MLNQDYKEMLQILQKHDVDYILVGAYALSWKYDRKWVEVAKRRLKELRSGRVKAVPGAQVFARVRERFGK